MGDIRSVVEWLTDGARSGSRSEDVLRELCHRMIDGGIPLWRAAVFVNTLHPGHLRPPLHLAGRQGRRSSRTAQYDMLETDEYRQSPITAVHANGQPIRRHLADGDCPDDFPVLARAARRRRDGLCGVPAGVHRLARSMSQPGRRSSRRLHASAICRSRIDHRAADAGRGNPRPAADRHEPAQHLCRPPGRRAHPDGRDPARPRRGDPRRDLALRHARLHRHCRAAAAAGAGRSAQPIFRLPGAADPRPRRRGAQVHR